MGVFDARGIGEGPRPRLVGETPAPPPAEIGAGGASFADTLQHALTRVDQLGTEANDKMAALARGEPVEVHDIMVAMGKSEVAFNLMLEVRNKVIEAWERLVQSVT